MDQKIKFRTGIGSKYFLGFFLILFLTSSCATKAYRSSTASIFEKENFKILCLPIDIQLSSITAGGLLKPEAKWTKESRQYVEQAFRQRFAEMGLNFLGPKHLKKVELNQEEHGKQNQLLKLHQAVGRSILIHKYVSELALPSKDDFDWSIGPEASFFQEKYGADYALFVYLRDSYASMGRVAFFFAAAALGAYVPMGRQVGFASLIDLRTGQVVWFNRLSRGIGDLRTEEAAAKTVNLLLTDLKL